MIVFLCSLLVSETLPAEVVIAATVVDSRGVSIADAQLRMRTIKNFAASDREVRKGGFAVVTLKKSECLTNSDGKWTSPPLPAGAGYVVEAKAPGFVGDFSRWVHPIERGRIELPPIKLRRLVSVSGSVQDRNGKPIANARVFANGDGPALRECRTDADGNFILKDVPEGRILIFAETDQHYLTGSLHDGSKPLALTLAPRSAANPERMPPQPPAKPLPADAAVVARAKKDAIEHANAVFAQKNDDLKGRTANLTAFHAPDHMLRLARSATYEKWFARDQSLYMVAVSLDRKAKWEAEIIASEIGHDYRHSVYNSLVYYEKDSARRYEHFSRIALEARDSQDDQTRMIMLANLAQSMADAGFAKEARPLAQEAQDILERLPASASNENLWFMIVNAWSLIDSTKVRELAHRVKIVEERLACNVARIDPIVAKEIYDGYLKRTPKPRGGHWISELAYAMAKSDLATAERYADVVLLRTDRFDSVGSPEILAPPKLFGVNLEIPSSNEGPAMWRAVLQGYLADARREVGDQEGAKRLLADAVSRLERIKGEAWHTGGGFLWSRSTCMAALIPLAERIDESLVAELVWKTLANREPMEEIDSNALEQREYMANLSAGVIARYRPDLARHVIEANSNLQTRQSWRGSAGLWAGLAYFDVDPAAAARWSESLCELPNPFSTEKPAKSPRAVAQTFLSSLLKVEKHQKPTLRRWCTLLSMLWLENVVDKDVRREL